MKKNSIKNVRINSEVQKELSRIIRESKDPRIHPFTSVLSVEVATDLKTCKAYISVLGTDEDRKRTAEGLKSASGFISRELARRLNMSNTPQITFIMDTSIEDAIKMTQLIDEVNKSAEDK